MKQKYFTVAAMFLGLFAIGSTSSLAGDVSSHLSRSLVTACSWYGHQTCYTAPLQRDAHGKKLVLHHGTRIDCGRDCENTLREATVDFWDTMRENGG